MKLFAISALAFAAIIGASPSFALDGGEAYNQCRDTDGCKVTVNDNGNITIDGPKGGVVWCASWGSTCEVVRHAAERTVQDEATPSKPLLMTSTFGSLSSSESSQPAHGGELGTFDVSISIGSNATLY